MNDLEIITFRPMKDIGEKHKYHQNICIMEGVKPTLQFQLEEQITHIFSEFLTRFAKLEELVLVGSRFLYGFQQGLEFLRRPPINKTSELVENIIKTNNSKRVQSYIHAGCINTHDSVQNISKIHECLRGLQDSLSQAKCILDELNLIIKDAANAMQTANEDSSNLQNKQFANTLDHKADSVDNMGDFSSSRAEATDYAAMMGVIYIMLKQDYTMQEKIVSSLTLKSSSEELESYCTMWSLRPYINDDIVHQAWKFIS